MQNLPKSMQNIKQSWQEQLDNKVHYILDAGFKDFDKIVFMPQIPILGFPREFVIEEWFGIKVAKLISPPQD